MSPTPRHLRLRAVVLPVAAALTMSCGPGTVTPHDAAPPRVSVNGKFVDLVGPATVGSALSRTLTNIPSGRLLSVNSHRSLGSDQRPGTVLVNGTMTDIQASLQDGDQVVTVAGPDTFEATRTAIVGFGLHLLATLEVGNRPGTARVTLGAVSGEVVRRTVLSEPIPGRLTSPRQIALTFDDGPNPAWTPRVLALLASARVRATFCLIGHQVEQYPQMVRAIVAGGHTLCNHTWDHDEQLNHRAAARASQEMLSTQAAIFAATGVRPKLFRAPGGAWSPQIEAIARSQHLTPLKWTADPRDWSRPGVRAILSQTLARLKPRGILLLHDGGGNRDQTVAALRYLLVRLPLLRFTYGVPRP